MSDISNSYKYTASVEILQQGQKPLFLIHANNLVLGNYKYGSPEKSIPFNKNVLKSDVKPQLFEISCMETNKPFELFPDAMSYYVFYGAFDQDEVVVLRKFPFIKNAAFLRQLHIFDKHTIIKYNPNMRRWTRSRFSELPPISDSISDLITFKLIDHDYLSFHAAGLELDGKAYLLTGLPDIGKTYATMKLIQDGARFMSEDIIIINKEARAIGLPFTATMEKRGDFPLIEQIKAKVHEFFIQENYSKNTFFDTSLYNGENVCHDAQINGIFFLKKGKPGYSVADKKKVLTDFININRLEFTYWRNLSILTYLFFRNVSIDEYLKKEVALLERLVSQVPIYDIYAPDYTGYAPIIEQVINEQS